MAFPDVVDLMVDYLDPIVDPVRVVTRVPKPRPARLVQVRRVGGQPVLPVRDQARLDVFTWGPDDPDAMALALQVRTAVWALAGTDLLGPVVYQVDEFMSPRQADDPQAPQDRSRVWATYTVTVRADDVIQPAPSAFS
jgi:hypothetical protein